MLSGCQQHQLISSTSTDNHLRLSKELDTKHHGQAFQKQRFFFFFLCLFRILLEALVKSIRGKDEFIGEGGELCLPEIKIHSILLELWLFPSAGRNPVTKCVWGHLEIFLTAYQKPGAVRHTFRPLWQIRWPAHPWWQVWLCIKHCPQSWYVHDVQTQLSEPPLLPVCMWWRTAEAAAGYFWFCHATRVSSG